MDLDTINKNYATKEDFESMLENHKPITMNKAVDILGYIIAKDRDDLIEPLFNSIDDEYVKSTLLDAVKKLDSANLEKPTVKKIIGTGALTEIMINDSIDDVFGSSSRQVGETGSDQLTGKMMNDSIDDAFGSSSMKTGSDQLTNLIIGEELDDETSEWEDSDSDSSYN
jgi:hypothetical protein